MTIPDADEVLRYLVGDAFDSNKTQVGFDSPTTSWVSELPADKITINLYLYHVAENTDKRKGGIELVQEPDGQIGESEPPVMVNLSYIASVWVGSRVRAPNADHEALSTLVLLAHSVRVVPTAAIPETAWVPEDFTLQLRPALSSAFNPADVAHFWNTMGHPWRPAVPILLTIPLETKVKRRYSMVGTKILRFEPGSEQRLQIAGIVKSSEPDEEPIVGANVVLLDAANTVLATAGSGSDGRFSVTSPVATGLTMHTTHDGYRTVKTKIDSIHNRNRADISIRLKRAGG